LFHRIHRYPRKKKKKRGRTVEAEKGRKEEETSLAALLPDALHCPVIPSQRYFSPTLERMKGRGGGEKGEGRKTRQTTGERRAKGADLLTSILLLSRFLLSSGACRSSTGGGKRAKISLVPITAFSTEDDWRGGGEKKERKSKQALRRQKIRSYPSSSSNKFLRAREGKRGEGKEKEKKGGGGGKSAEPSLLYSLPFFSYDGRCPGPKEKERRGNARTST